MFRYIYIFLFFIQICHFSRNNARKKMFFIRMRCTCKKKIRKNQHQATLELKQLAYFPKKQNSHFAAPAERNRPTSAVKSTFRHSRFASISWQFVIPINHSVSDSVTGSVSDPSFEWRTTWHVASDWQGSHGTSPPTYETRRPAVYWSSNCWHTHCRKTHRF